jgi:hypothetical protein
MKVIILWQSKGGIQKIDANRLLIKIYISTDNDMFFDRVKQLIGFRLSRVAIMMQA